MSIYLRYVKIYVSPKYSDNAADFISRFNRTDFSDEFSFKQIFIE